jgi:hypothetical protein
MARIRTIKPEFPQSESMGRVSRESRLCFILLWTLADDVGRLRGSSRMLASLLYPYDDDAKKLIERWLNELEAESCIVQYRTEGDSYIQICNWLKHQKIDRPSKSRIPALDEASRVIATPLEDSSGDLRIKDQGSKDQGSKDQTPAKRGSRLPDDFELTHDRAAVASGEGIDPSRTFASFCDYWRSLSGVKAAKLDWDATWRNWCRTEGDRKRPRAPAAFAEPVRTWRPTEDG